MNVAEYKIPQAQDTAGQVRKRKYDMVEGSSKLQTATEKKQKIANHFFRKISWVHIIDQKSNISVFVPKDWKISRLHSVVNPTSFCQHIFELVLMFLDIWEVSGEIHFPGLFYQEERAFHMIESERIYSVQEASVEVQSGMALWYESEYERGICQGRLPHEFRRFFSPVYMLAVRTQSYADEIYPASALPWDTHPKPLACFFLSDCTSDQWLKLCSSKSPRWGFATYTLPQSMVQLLCSLEGFPGYFVEFSTLCEMACPPS